MRVPEMVINESELLNRKIEIIERNKQDWDKNIDVVCRIRCQGYYEVYTGETRREVGTWMMELDPIGNTRLQLK